MRKVGKIAGFAVLAMVAAQPAAAKKEAPELTKCEESMGSIALVEGDQAGWNEWGLGSPRGLVNALAIESGCFTPLNPAAGTPARYLVTVIAGSQEEVDQGMEVAKSAATEAMLRSGAASSVLSKVPIGGALLGAFGGFGGKKKTVAAGMRVVSPVNGLTLAAGSGSVKKSRIKFGRANYGWAANAADAAGYQNSKDGKMLTEAFIIAFNQVVEQQAVITMAPQAASAVAEPETVKAIVAVETSMYAAASAEGESLRSLRAGTELTPTGNREGLMIEVSDNYGTTGWVSVEDMQ
ncbi:MAG: SH3 domain-containing protein [Erythrobacter sp.]